MTGVFRPAARLSLRRLASLGALGLALSFTAACDLDEVEVKDQDGAALQVEGKAGKKVVTAPDGTQYTVKPGGTIVDSEGNKTKIKRDGTIVQPDGSRVNIYGDGTKTTLKVDGVELAEDGSKTLQHDDGSKTVIKADGSVERIYKDGTKTKIQSSSGGADKPAEGDKSGDKPNDKPAPSESAK